MTVGRLLVEQARGARVRQDAAARRPDRDREGARLSGGCWSPTPRRRDTRSALDVFAAMKPSAYFVNLARGGVVDEDAMMAALKAGQIAGAALDVFQTEPLPRRPSAVVDGERHHHAASRRLLRRLRRSGAGDGRAQYGVLPARRHRQHAGSDPQVGARRSVAKRTTDQTQGVKRKRRAATAAKPAPTPRSSVRHRAGARKQHRRR